MFAHLDAFEGSENIFGFESGFKNLLEASLRGTYADPIIFICFVSHFAITTRVGAMRITVRTVLQSCTSRQLRVSEPFAV